MKQKIFFLMLIIASVFTLGSCSSDDDEKSKEPQTKSYTEVGVWQSGNYFISFSSDHFLTAYVAPGFMDCGAYSRSDDVITSSNTYFAKTTTYNIKSIDDKSMTVNITYTDIAGESKTTSLTLTKSSKVPEGKDNPLIGKSYSYQSTHGITTMAFNTYNTGLMTSTWKIFAPYPLTVFYVYFENCVYFQEFKPSGRQMPSMNGWGNRADNGEIMVSKVTFGSDGSIRDMKDAAPERL